MQVGDRPRSFFQWQDNQSLILALISVLLVFPLVIFYIDAISYLYDYAFGAVFIVFYLLMSRVMKGPWLVAYALYLSVLIILGYFVSPTPLFAYEADLAGRIIKVLILWIIVILLYFLQRQQDRTLVANKQLNDIIRQQEQTRRELERQGDVLRQTNEELEAFSYAVSHDLRAPLRSIDGFSQALLEDYDTTLDAQGKDYLHRVRTNAQHMDTLIDAILRLSRQTRKELHREPVNITELSHAIITRLQNEDPARTIDITITDNITVQGDPELLGTAMENLIRNAWKYTSKQTHPHIDIHAQTQDGTPVVCVKDNGVGFDMNDAQRLFIPFQRLPNATDFPGIGIGLSTVRRIIQKHGGRIWATSKPGHGAEFCFTLPKSTPS